MNIMNKNIFYIKNNKLILVIKDYIINGEQQFNSCIHNSLYDIFLILTEDEMNEYVKKNDIDILDFDENFNKKDNYSL
jgi:hypothetical protein